MAIKTKKHPDKPTQEHEPAGITFLKLVAAGVGVIILLVLLAALFFIPTSVVTTYETPYDMCIAAGNPMLKTYPPKCVWPGGPTVVQIIPGVNDIKSFDDCAAAGYPIMESYPEQCRTNEGQVFTRTIYTCQTTLPYEGPTPELNAYDVFNASCYSYNTPESCAAADVENGCVWKELFPQP